jgi:tRNA(fMet)-specific endonuclease VapC
MTLYILDADSLTLAQFGHPELTRRLDLEEPTRLAVTVISVEEQLSGWYTMLRRANRPDKLARVYQRLAETVTNLAQWTILPFTEAAIDRTSRLRSLKLNVGKMDLAIAAIVLEHNGVLVTRNARDFGRVPALAIEDWSVSSP